VNVTVLPVFGLSGERHVSAKEMWNTMSKVVADLDLFSYVQVYHFFGFCIKLMICVYLPFFDIILQDGHFSRENFNAGASMPSSLGETLCAAVTASTWVEPHGRCTVAFALAWSSPQVKFQKGCTYNRSVFSCFSKMEYTFVHSMYILLAIYLQILLMKQHLQQGQMLRWNNTWVSLVIYSHWTQHAFPFFVFYIMGLHKGTDIKFTGTVVPNKSIC
jgi:hypothetical protein